MRVNGYGVRPGNNGYSGQQRSGDEFNSSFKTIRFTSAEEYATRNVKEYHHYPEQKDLTKEDDDKKQQDSSQNSNNSQNGAKNSARSGLQAIQQIVVAIAGSAVIATSYTTAMAAKRAEKQVDDPSAAVTDTTDQSGKDDGKTIPAYIAEWEWSADNKQAFLILKDISGKQIARVEATITVKEEPADCRTTGKKIYTASAEAEGETFTDSREEEIPPVGHTFGEEKEITLDNGKTAVEVECTRCGEHFVIQNSFDEE